MAACRYPPQGKRSFGPGRCAFASRSVGGWQGVGRRLRSTRADGIEGQGMVVVWSVHACGVVVGISMGSGAVDSRRLKQTVRRPPQTPHQQTRSDYLGEANAHIATLAMIETAEAMANLEEIVRVDGLDGVFIGVSWEREEKEG